MLLNATLTPAERDLLADDAQPALRIFSAADLAGLADGPGPPAELAPYPLTRPMHYTSGTTGRPKGVTTGIWDEATARAVFEDEAAVWHFDRRDLHLVCSPMYHTVSVRFSTGTLLSGGSLAILSRFDAATALDTAAPTAPDDGLLGPDPPAADPPVPRPRRRRDLRLAPPPGPRRRALPGVAEAGRHGAGAPRDAVGVLRLDGGPVHGLLARGVARAAGHGGRARVGRRLFVDRSGTIWCDMPGFARFSYWRDPAATRRAWRGAACTIGDLGRLDPDGYLYLTGRRHDLIISGGVNVYPAEVENVLAAVEGVREVAVFGLPDEQWGQRVCAAYVAEGTQGVEEALRAAASARLAPYKRPKTYIAAADLPHTATGKLMRRAVPEHLGLDATGRTG